MKFLGEVRGILWAYVFFVLVNLGDIGSSLLNNGTPRVSEGNPYLRNINGQFLLSRAIHVKLMMLAFWGMTSLFIYLSARPVNKTVAVLAAAALPLYYGFDMLQVVASNLLLWTRWYVG
jgi:hypothetical protein